MLKKYKFIVCEVPTALGVYKRKKGLVLGRFQTARESDAFMHEQKRSAYHDPTLTTIEVIFLSGRL